MDKEITLTPTSKIVEMTAALPEIPNGAKPVVYEQVVASGAALDAKYGKPDPVHND